MAAMRLSPRAGFWMVPSPLLLAVPGVDCMQTGTTDMWEQNVYEVSCCVQEISLLGSEDLGNQDPIQTFFGV